MNKSISLILALTICAMFANCTQAQNSDDLDGEEESAVTIALTKLDVNDTELKLSWKIKNNADHEVWICDSMNNTSPSIFEQFLDKDSRTLVLRRRFGLPGRIQSQERRNPAGLYVRLRAGQEKAESISIALPVEPQRLFSGELGNAEYAERLALEIGFYDENLPALILEIVELAEHLDIDLSIGYHGFRNDIRDRFFGGPILALLFKSDLGFGPNVRSADANGEMWMFHMDETHMGEKVLWIEIDNVSIPYKSNYPPLTSQGAKSTKDHQSRDTTKNNKGKPTSEKG